MPLSSLDRDIPASCQLDALLRGPGCANLVSCGRNDLQSCGRRLVAIEARAAARAGAPLSLCEAVA